MTLATLPLKSVERIVHHVYVDCLLGFNASDCSQHFCSPAVPCKQALDFLAPFLSLRLVASCWNTAVNNFQQTTREDFFSRVEDGYYPHPWHINTRVRKAVLLSRYRVFRTIHTEAGNRGVYFAYDFGGLTGCAAAREVVVKAWVSSSDFECQREVAAYRTLGGADPCPGVPTPEIASARHDPFCDVHALVLPKLGPTLEDLREMLPHKRLDERMVLTVAIQMIERYGNIHARGLVHSGVKPGNICLAPRGSTDEPTMLYAIDFGFSSALDVNSSLPSPHRIDAVGNRRFMSVFAHHGISQSQRDDLESLAYLLSYLFHARLPWDSPSGQSPRPRPRSMSPQTATAQQQQPHVWRVKIATPAAVLFRDMDACFHEFWRDVKALAYAEVPDYGKMRQRFAARLKAIDEGKAPFGWWDIWEQSI
ncbi:kinase-like domain-containing protein [Mycena maculata]|uniref:Kinase-like domain-containing protein n=1 Tax=Mycena maculata TaxID=230809 RepID=A0AAD7JRD3_9AGAR|nr:kinase-like domain-containing protein [Mycena maculata]